MCRGEGKEPKENISFDEGNLHTDEKLSFGLVRKNLFGLEKIFSFSITFCQKTKIRKTDYEKCKSTRVYSP